MGEGADGGVTLEDPAKHCASPARGPGSGAVGEERRGGVAGPWRQKCTSVTSVGVSGCLASSGHMTNLPE